METNIAELLCNNRQQQSIMKKKIKEQKNLAWIAWIQGFCLLILLIICTLHSFTNFGLLFTLINLGVIAIVIKKGYFYR